MRVIWCLTNPDVFLALAGREWDGDGGEIGVCVEGRLGRRKEGGVRG